MGDINKRVGARIRTLRTAKRISLQKLAELAGISEKHLGKVERGAANASLQCIEAISLALGVRLAELVDAEFAQAQPVVLARTLEMLPDLSEKEKQAVFYMVKVLAGR